MKRKLFENMTPVMLNKQEPRIIHVDILFRFFLFAFVLNEHMFSGD